MKRTRGTRRCLNSLPHAFQYGRIAAGGGGWWESFYSEHLISERWQHARGLARKIKTEQRYVKFLHWKRLCYVLARFSQHRSKTLLPYVCFYYEAFQEFAEPWVGERRAYRGEGSRACREAWQEMSHASEDITTREASACSHSTGDTNRERRTANLTEILSPRRNIARRVTREHPVNSSRANRIIRLDELPEKKWSGNLCDMASNFSR